MATPAIENLLQIYPDAEITIFGSFVSTEIFKSNPKVKRVILDTTKKEKNRIFALWKIAREIGEFDLAISFRSHFSTRVLLLFLKAKKKAFFKKKEFKNLHQVQKYSSFINKILDKDLFPKDLKLYFEPFKFQRKTLGINPGATYGDAKRWYPKEFAKVALFFKDDFDIVIFGGPNEIKIATEIENLIKKDEKARVFNLAGKTSISQLASKIAGLDLFITNDSGPMHIATAYKIPTVAIFGPTNSKETSPWKNPKSIIVKKNLACAPCMKRTCPLKTHECMKNISADEVILVAKTLLKN